MKDELALIIKTPFFMGNSPKTTSGNVTIQPAYVNNNRHYFPCKYSIILGHTFLPFTKTFSLLASINFNYN